MDGKMHQFFHPSKKSVHHSMSMIIFIFVPVKWMEKCIEFFVHKKKSLHHSIIVIIFICVPVKWMEKCIDILRIKKVSASFDVCDQFHMCSCEMDGKMHRFFCPSKK